MSQRILVINPNSLQAVTDGISSALDGFRFAGGPDIQCETLHSGPPGIETQTHVDGITEKLVEWFDQVPDRKRADAVVVACFSDPGVTALRESLPMPVFGIGEASYLAAVPRAERFGVIAILSRSIPRHRRTQRSLGLDHRLAGELAIDLGVAELASEEIVWKRMSGVGRRLREECGAGVLILGCAGMARYRGRLEDLLGIPVIDPTQAAVGMAMAVLLARRSAGATARAAA